jgi:hypothetical protein
MKPPHENITGKRELEPRIAGYRSGTREFIPVRNGERG